MSSESELRELNDKYIAAFMNADVAWYQEHLTDDFVCIESDGTVLGKAEFLRGAAEGPDVAEYRLVEVDVRVLGAGADVAQVRATGAFVRKDGTRGTSRYIDVYLRRDGAWKAVSAQITRSVS